ncbi:Delta(6)-protoilludene synthase [Colletotrichum sp. SAR 10_65]|nr:Delta(6)-protoilludene synthase [Colletotrichum sp. SAR 10_65]KAI8185229.1 Delta(6)-protoilludene synthase [Colletotrichum sp. SAR 10_75]KAJ4997492.1 Delta(6)-protoilludene synthase [Colletotrichum sp. SAR 10_66]
MTFKNRGIDTMVTIPDFLAHWPAEKGWPWRVELHPDSENIKSEAETWMRSFSGIPANFVNKIVAASFPEMACINYAHMDKGSCLLAAQVMLLFFVIDETTDTGDKEEVRRQCLIVKDAFSFSDAVHNKPPSSGHLSSMELMAKDVAERYLATGTKESWQLFRDLFNDYLDGVVEEAGFRRRLPALPNRNEYMTVRQRTIDMYPSIAFLLIKCEVRRESWEEPTIQSLMDMCFRVIINQNDMYSFDKERAKGEDSHNGVRIMMNEFDIGVQEAMDRLGAETRGLVSTFIDLSENMPTTETMEDYEHQKLLLEGCIAWIIGMDVWSLHVTTRYHGQGGLNKYRAYKPRPKRL